MRQQPALQARSIGSLQRKVLPPTRCLVHEGTAGAWRWPSPSVSNQSSLSASVHALHHSHGRNCGTKPGEGTYFRFNLFPCSPSPHWPAVINEASLTRTCSGGGGGERVQCHFFFQLVRTGELCRRAAPPPNPPPSVLKYGTLPVSSPAPPAGYQSVVFRSPCRVSSSRFTHTC